MKLVSRFVFLGICNGEGKAWLEGGWVGGWQARVAQLGMAAVSDSSSCKAGPVPCLPQGQRRATCRGRVQPLRCSVPNVESHPAAVVLGDSERRESLQDLTGGVAVRTANSSATTLHPCLSLKKKIYPYVGGKSSAVYPAGCATLLVAINMLWLLQMNAPPSFTPATSQALKSHWFF